MKALNYRVSPATDPFPVAKIPEALPGLKSLTRMRVWASIIPVRKRKVMEVDNTCTMYVCEQLKVEFGKLLHKIGPQGEFAI